MIAQYGDIKPPHVYRERPLGYSEIRSTGSSENYGTQVGVGVGFAVGGGAAAILGVAMIATAVTIEATRAETEKRRTERLNAALPLNDREAQVLQQVGSGLKTLGYSVGTPMSLKHGSVDAKGPFKVGRLLPTIEEDAWKTTFVSPAAGDAVLMVNVLNYGVFKIERAFKQAKHIPFVVVGVRMYRMDTHKTVHRATYVGLPMTPLPTEGTIDDVLKESKLVRDYYDQALANVSRLIVEDLRPATSVKK